MEMSFEEYKNEVQKKVGKGKRKFKVTNSIGVYDIFKMMRKKGWYDLERPLRENEFYAVVRGVGKLLAEELAMGHDVTFPFKMGKLELRKSERGVSLVDGKLKVTYPIDWDETVRLWYADEEARKNKTLLRREEKNVYRVKYCKYDASYSNKVFYRFVLNTFIREKLRDNIRSGKVDSLWRGV